MSTFGWAYVDCADTTGSAFGAHHTVQFLTGAGQTTGTLDFTYYSGAYGGYAASTLVLTGTLIVSGTVSASNYNVKEVTQIDSTGSTIFGNTDDDRHIRTGSLTVVNYNGSTVALHATSSTGNVGIGTTSPGEKLDISLSGQNGGLRVINSTDNAYLKLDAPSDEAAYIDFSTGQNNDWQIGRRPGSNDLTIYDNDGAEDYIFTWQQGGKVGIGTLTPTQQLEVSGTTYLSGGLAHKRQVITTAKYTASIDDYFIGISTQNNAVEISLPAASSLTNGQVYVIKDEYGNANNNNIIIYKAHGGSDTIDGQNSVTLQSPYGSISLYCNGTNKYFVY